MKARMAAMSPSSKASGISTVHKPRPVSSPFSAMAINWPRIQSRRAATALARTSSASSRIDGANSRMIPLLSRFGSQAPKRPMNRKNASEDQKHRTRRKNRQNGQADCENHKRGPLFHPRSNAQRAAGPQ
jgi:hypothetical protein